MRACVRGVLCVYIHAYMRVVELGSHMRIYTKISHTHNRLAPEFFTAFSQNPLRKGGPVRKGRATGAAPPTPTPHRFNPRPHKTIHQLKHNRSPDSKCSTSTSAWAASRSRGGAAPSCPVAAAVAVARGRGRAAA